MTPERKEEILECTYGIPMNYELKEAAARMCNLADLVEERGIEKGIEKGIQEGMRRRTGEGSAPFLSVERKSKTRLFTPLGGGI